MKKFVVALAFAASAAVIALALVLAFAQSSSPPRSPAKTVATPQAAAVVPASLVQVPAFGANPSGLVMNVYVPNSVRPDPAILLALHWGCASGTDFYNLTGFSTLADEYGFIVIFPSSPSDCWDTSSSAALRHDGGSDPVGLTSMITYTERKYHADPRRVYVTGASAGGMMTAVMPGDYPNVFKAGAIFEAVPFGCPLSCTGFPTSLPPQQWGGPTCSASARRRSRPLTRSRAGPAPITGPARTTSKSRPTAFWTPATTCQRSGWRST